VPEKHDAKEPFEALVRQASAGDRAACREIYRMYAEFVTRVVRRNLDSSHDIEDVVQETFVSAFRGLGHLSDKSALRGWLKTIAVRSSMRALRKRYTHREVFNDVSVDEVPVVGVTQPALAQELYWALGELPATLRRPWVSSRIKGRCFGDVAEEFELSESTVKRRVREADARLRRRLTPPGRAEFGALSL